ncbi:MAG: cytosine permease [Hyphomonadaceae bacterium]
MPDQSNEFATVSISDDQLVPWPRVAAVAAMVGFSLPTFITGLEVSQGLSPITALWALVLGSLIILAIGAIMGAIGAASRMSSYLLVRIAFGDKGASIVNIAFAISLLGWFGVNINLFTDAISQLTLEAWGLRIPTWLLAIFASACMTLTTIFGFKAINMLATLMVPVLAIVTFLFAQSALGTQSLTEILATDRVATITMGQGISAIVGAIIIGAIILPDITRFVRHWSGAIYTALIAYMVVQLIVMGSGALAGISTGKTDILQIMLDLNLGIGAFLIVIGSSWVLNSLNLYSAILGTKATFPKLNSTWLAIGLGGAGVIAALLNLLDNFIPFMIFLSDIFIPVAGVIIIDALFVRRKDYKIDTLANNHSFNVPGLTAWAIAAGFALLVSNGHLTSPSGIASVDAIVLSGIVYFTLLWLSRKIQMT